MWNQVGLLCHKKRVTFNTDLSQFESVQRYFLPNGASMLNPVWKKCPGSQPLSSGVQSPNWPPPGINKRTDKKRQKQSYVGFLDRITNKCWFWKKNMNVFLSHSPKPCSFYHCSLTTFCLQTMDISLRTDIKLRGFLNRNVHDTFFSHLILEMILIPKITTVN